jgi:hypothetical protein
MKTGPAGKAQGYRFSERAQSDSVVFLRRSGSGKGRDRWTKWPRCRMPSDGRILAPINRPIIRVAGRDLRELSAGQGNSREERKRP